MLLPEMFTGRTCGWQMLGAEETAHLSSTAKEMIIPFRRGLHRYNIAVIMLVNDLDKISKSELQLGNNSPFKTVCRHVRNQKASSGKGVEVNTIFTVLQKLIPAFTSLNTSKPWVDFSNYSTHKLMKTIHMTLDSKVKDKL